MESQSKADSSNESKSKESNNVDVSDIHVCNGMTVHGAFIGQLSPIKISRTNADVKYFDGFFSDGKKTVRMVSFEPKLKAKIEEKASNKELAITNCSVQKRKASDELEIVAGSKSDIICSPKKFRIDNDLVSSTCPSGTSVCTCNASSLEEISSFAINQHINITGKVQSVKPVETVKGRHGTLTKQDIVIADSTGVCQCVLWERDVGKCLENNTYQLNNVTIRSFNGIKYLSLSEKSSVEEVQDLGDVVTGTIDDEGPSIVEGEIIAVTSCDKYNSCRNSQCKAKVIDVTSEFGECSKCGMKVKLS